MTHRLSAILVLALLCTVAMGARKKSSSPDLWPDGTPIPAWFSDTSRVDVTALASAM